MMAGRRGGCLRRGRAVVRLRGGSNSTSMVILGDTSALDTQAIDGSVLPCQARRCRFTGMDLMDMDAGVEKVIQAQGAHQCSLCGAYPMHRSSSPSMFFFLNPSHPPPCPPRPTHLLGDSTTQSHSTNASLSHILSYQWHHAHTHTRTHAHHEDECIIAILISWWKRRCASCGSSAITHGALSSQDEEDSRKAHLVLPIPALTLAPRRSLRKNRPRTRRPRNVH
jgi:hypothetical protein